MRDLDLWKRLQSFSVDDDTSALGFIDRLADENGWARSYAKEVFAEYLKFIYLAAIADEIRTPSDAVDQVWHLHLSYSHSYWQDLCEDLLGKRLHHGPTKGGSAEIAKYRTAYARTLNAYREEFGEEPPARIWPPVDVRFRRAQHYRRVDVARHVVIGKRTITALIVGAAALAILVAAKADSATLRGTAGTLLLLVGVPGAFLFGLWVIEKLGIRGGKGGGGCGTGGGCSGCSGCGSCGGCGGD